MLVRSRLVNVLATCVFLVATTLALGAEEPPIATPEGGPVAAVEAFHQALARGDGAAALALVDDEVVIFESGGAERSADEYAHHHLGADMELAAATRRRVTDRQVHEKGDVAWVTTCSETRGTFRERPIASRGTETMILERQAGGWRIVHIHWSSAKIAEP